MCEKLEDFLKELTLLTQKYELILGSCGCCDSIYLNKVNPNDPDGYLGSDGHYDGDKDGKCITWEKNE
jgi:hypothetical protein